MKKIYGASAVVIVLIIGFLFFKGDRTAQISEVTEKNINSDEKESLETLLDFEKEYGFKDCDIPALKKFEKKAEDTMTFESLKEKVDIDLVRLMRKTIMVESDCTPNIKHPVAKGITQIEPATFNGMASDRNFRETFQEIEKRFDVNLKRDWITDPYTNIVAAYAVYRWKMMDVPQWWDKRHNFKQLKDNYSDNEWNLYKVYFNSIAGKTTLNRWNKFDVS